MRRLHSPHEAETAARQLDSRGPLLQLSEGRNMLPLARAAMFAEILLGLEEDYLAAAKLEVEGDMD
jgi:hypothetical protein